MHHFFLDYYSRRNSPIHRLPASLKLVGVLLAMLLAVLTPVSKPYCFLALALLLAAMVLLSRLPILFLLKRLLFLEPFVLGVAVLALFQPHGKEIFLSIFIRSTISLSFVILLSSTTPFTELIQVLRRVHTPPILVTTLALMYRYLFVLLDELERMQRARNSRSFTTKRVHRWKQLADTVGQLFIRTTERGERIYSAMCARGWK